MEKISALKTNLESLPLLALDPIVSQEYPLVLEVRSQRMPVLAHLTNAMVFTL